MPKNIANKPFTPPDHVPPELVWDNSYGAFLGELDDPFEAAGRLHEGPGVIWARNATAGGFPAWIPTRHELIKEAFSDSDNFSSKRGRSLEAIMDPGWLLLPVESDPPDHQYYRNILFQFFSPVTLSALTAEVQQMCDSLIAKFEERGECEFVSEFSSILPNAIVVSMMGMPQQMLPQFLQWEEAVVHSPDPAQRLAAGQAIIDYLKSFIAEQKAHPTSDLLTAIVAGKVAGRGLTDAEILGMCYLLFVAGLDTVYNTLGWVMRHLAIDQSLQQRLRANPADIPAAIEEFTRAYGVSAPSRTVARDFEFHGVMMRKGDDVILPTVLAGRDPRAFPNPHKIDIDRKPKHVTFGAGRHLCLGVHLAKREIKVVIESFLSRMNNIHIPAGSSHSYHTQSTIGLDSLHLAWDR